MPYTKDPLFKKVALLLPFDGSDGSTTITDESLNALTCTASGGAAIEVDQSVYGGSALYLPGGAARVAVTGNPALLNGAGGSTCFEAWVYTTSLAARQTIFDQRGGPSGTAAWGAVVWIETTGAVTYWFRGGTAEAKTAAGAVPVNTWVHIACVYDQTGSSNQTHRIYINGVQSASDSFSGSLTELTNNNAKIGCQYDDTVPFVGYIDDLRYTAGNARYPGGVTFIPDGPHPTEFGFDGLTFFQVFVRSGEQPAPSAHVIAEPVMLKNLNFGGRGQIVGTVKEDLTPTDLPLRRRVQLYAERGGVLVGETWSNATTGAYAFTYIDYAIKYFVVTFDYEQNHRAVIADNLTPELMP